MEYKILASGSSGNAVVINSEILIDIGVPMKTIRESGYIKELKLVLLTHSHGDHFNPSTVQALHRERPALRWACCKWMIAPLLEAGVGKLVIDVFDVEKRYCYGFLDLWAVPIPHDVPNCAWKISFTDINKGKEDNAFYATDCATLDGIEAKDYSLYMIEANHGESEIQERIFEKEARREFAYERRAQRTHLSREQALDWLAKNAGPESHYIFLHEHKNKGGE